jgi:hypothetical protein
MKRVLITVLFAFQALWVLGQRPIAENVFLITLDGLRWQELFDGADSVIINDSRYVRDIEGTKEKYYRSSGSERREALMPWFWTTLVDKGYILGNRWAENLVNVTNEEWFSYPGYNEILTGKADANINSNDKIANPNVTVLELINRQVGFEEKVAAFGSWDVFPYIINEERSNIYVNAGFEPAQGQSLTERELFLNELQAVTPSPWSSVRLDVFTHYFAKEYIEKNLPRVVYIAYGETDDFAHDGAYDHYLDAANRTDQFIKDLWDFCQSHPKYQNKTAFIITTDHGRGDIIKEEWTSHGNSVEAAGAIWVAAIGQGIAPLGEMKSKGQWYQNQIAATVLQLLGLETNLLGGETGHAIKLKE